MLTCAICGHTSIALISHLKKGCHPDIWGYVSEHGSIVNDAILKTVEGAMLARRTPVGVSEFCGVSLVPQEGVPLEACLPRPLNYRPPTFGASAQVAQFLTVGLQAGMNTFLYGPPGSGKDAFFHAYSAFARIPAIKCQVIPGADTQAWLWSRSLAGGDTIWEEGSLLKLVRDGYEKPSGERVPAMVLLSDFDRAQDDQIETFRLLLDTIAGGRIPTPQGGSVPLFPGTVFAATANTVGAGDSTGKYVSSNVIDASILNRFKVVRKMPFLDWEDEQVPLLERFPGVGKLPGFLPGIRDSSGSWSGLGAMVKIIRTMIDTGKLYGEFTHRDLCNWLEFSEELKDIYSTPEVAINAAFALVLDRFDTEAQHSIRLAVQGHLPRVSQ